MTLIGIFISNKFENFTWHITHNGFQYKTFLLDLTNIITQYWSCGLFSFTCYFGMKILIILTKSINHEMLLIDHWFTIYLQQVICHFCLQLETYNIFLSSFILIIITLIHIKIKRRKG
jgi:hypothetical protein